MHDFFFIVYVLLNFKSFLIIIFQLRFYIFRVFNILFYSHNGQIIKIVLYDKNKISIINKKED